MDNLSSPGDVLGGASVDANAAIDDDELDSDTQSAFFGPYELRQQERRRAQSQSMASQNEDAAELYESGTTHSDVPGIPGSANERNIIVETMRTMLNIDSPREFQVRAIYHGAFEENLLIYLVSKTGSGKSAVPEAINVLRRGVAVTLVPLIALGSDQVTKAFKIEINNEAYHIDEHKGSDASLLKERLLKASAEELNHVSINLFNLKRANFASSAFR